MKKYLYRFDPGAVALERSGLQLESSKDLFRHKKDCVCEAPSAELTQVVCVELESMKVALDRAMHAHGMVFVEEVKE